MVSYKTFVFRRFQVILLKKLRMDAGLSQRRLGRLCTPEVDPSYICNAENRGYRLYPSQLERLAAALGWEADPSDLLKEVGQ